MKDLAPTLRLSVGDTEQELRIDPGRRLSEVLREELGLRSVKVGCDAGDCGACTVLIDGAQTCACLVPAAQAEGARIETLETLAPDGQAVLARLQGAFWRNGAAQCGICTPGMLMAAVELLRAVPTPDATAVEEALGGVLCRCTGYAKIVAAVVAAGASAGESDAAEGPGPAAGQAVGRPVPRIDGLPKLRGTEIFGADHVPGGALLVRAVRSPHHAAGFSFGDLDRWAAAHHDIDAVLTAADIPGRNCFGALPHMADQPALAETHVRHRGEAVALIVGAPAAVEDLDLRTFPINWAPAPEALTPPESLAEGAPQLHAGRPGNALIGGRVEKGDPDRALAQSAYRVKGRFETGYVEHAYIEPEAGVAWMEGDTLVIQACTQAPVMDRDETAAILGLPTDRVRIIPAAAGGGFGAKLDLSVQPLIGLATLKTGKPCRMVWTRRESMQASTKRHPGTMTAEIGADATGRITAMTFEGTFNTGAYASWGPTVAVRVPVHASGPYTTPHYRATAQAVHTHGPISGAFRGFGVPQAAIAQESLYDDLARQAGIDRLEFRLRNALVDGNASATGQRLASVGMRACLEALSPHWAAAGHEARAFNDRSETRKRGIGLASCWYGCGNTALPNPSTIRIGITPEGRLKLHQGATDIGQGANTVIAQIAADALGVALEAIEIVGPDTHLTPDCGKTSASRQTFVTGRAAEAAGRALRAALERLTNLAQAEEIAFAPGAVIVRDGAETRRIPLAGMPPDANGYVLAAEETYDPPTSPLDANGQGDPFALYGYGAQMAEVEVDLALGTTRVMRMVAAHDLGRVINPVLAEGQIEGGIAQGLGLALMEDYVPGRTENLHDYLIPTIGDMPQITSILIEKPDPEGPMGARGLGEHALIPTAPAILNAIHDATGVRITRLPALPHRLRAALRERS